MAATAQSKQEGFAAFIKELVVLVLIVFLIRTFGFGLYQVPTGSMENKILVGERFFADKFSYIFTDPKANDIISFNAPNYIYSKNPLKYLWQKYVWGPQNWTKRVIATPGQKVKGTVEDGKPVVYVDGKKLDELYMNKYPLIHVYLDDPGKIRKKAKKDAENYVSQGRLRVSVMDQYIEQQERQSARWKSYDPTKPYDKQPFYDISPNRIVKDAQGNPEFLDPGTPLERNRWRDEAQHDGKNHWNGTDEFYVELGPDQYWVMGDNRQASQDSRFLGPIKRDLIHGKIIFRIWSNDSNEAWWIFDLIKHPINFWKQMRWGRFFKRVT